MTKREKRGGEQFVYQEVRQEIRKIETSMEEFVQMYGQQTRTRAGQAGGRIRGNQHEYTGSDGLIKLSTRLYDSEVGHRSKKKEERKFVITQHGGCSICTSWKHGADVCKEEYHLSWTRLRGCAIKGR